MKLKYVKPKGQRLMKRFNGIEIIEGDDCWWDNVDKKWKTISGCKGHSFQNWMPCRTVKAFKRHIRKHGTYMGKGRFCLSSQFVGYDVYA